MFFDVNDPLVDDMFVDKNIGMMGTYSLIEILRICGPANHSKDIYST